MKKILIWIGISIVMFSCESDPFVDEDTLSQLQVVESFVRIDDGQDEMIELDESSGEQSILLEYIFPANTDITVDYTLSGSAVFGTDFSIEGASASGGSIQLTHDASDDQITTESIVISILTDGVTDGTKTLTLTLSGATSSTGVPVSAGQGDLYKEVTLTIADLDCALQDLTGSYNYTVAGDIAGTGVITIVAGADGTWVLEDFAAGAFGAPVPYEILVADNGEVTAPETSAVSGVAATITGAVNTCTGTMLLNVTLNCCGAEGFMWTLSATPE